MAEKNSPSDTVTDSFTSTSYPANYTALNVTELVDVAPEENITAFLVVAVLGIVAVLAIATGCWIRKETQTPNMKKKRKKQKEKKERAYEEKRIGEVSLQSIKAAEFLRVYKQKLKDNYLDIEYKALSRLDENFPQQIAQLPCNQQKNVSPNVLPYDHCRVCLEAPPTNLDTDYINASFINRNDGENNVAINLLKMLRHVIGDASLDDTIRMLNQKTERAYIASQGPLASTIADFWRMIWQENLSTIVMLTNVFSYSKQECEKYWHATYSMYGDVQVRMDSCHQTCHYTIRHFTISKIGQSKERPVKQFQFHTWIPQEVPDTAAVLDFRRRVKLWTSSLKSKQPLLVHCGDGAGRTGAYIALDIILEKMQDTGQVDVLNTIAILRRYRPQMVNHQNQLKFLYEALCTALICGSTVVSAGELNSLVQKLSVRDPVLKITAFEQEYKTLREITPKLLIGECAGGHRVENRRKSRDIMTQPPERARPYLMTFDSSDSSDFINAVFVNGYNIMNEFIVTQWPMKNTCNDIWRLIFDAHITSVVVLHDPHSTRSFPEFWPKKEGVKQRYGPVCSTLTNTELTQNLLIKTFIVKKASYFDYATVGELPSPERLFNNIEGMDMQLVKKALINPTDLSTFGAESKPVQVAFLKQWPDSHKVPLHNHALLELKELVTNWKKENCAENTPTLVVSKNGIARAGVYCALSICLDQLKNDNEVDVFNATRTVMVNRPQLVENLTEYSFLYSFMNGMYSESHPAALSSNHRSALTIVTDNGPARKSNGINTRPKDSTELLLTRTKPNGSGLQTNGKSKSSFSTRELIDHKLGAAGQASRSKCPASQPESELTDGKGFLHYAVPVERHAGNESVNDDNMSDVSSFRMDPEIISLEDAEVANNPIYHV